MNHQPNHDLEHDRRTFLQLALAAGGAMALGGIGRASDVPIDAIPPVPATRTPGKPGDFSFLDGEWRIQNWRLPSGETAWDLFEGEATCRSLLGGIASVEELRIPARNFSGIGLRLLDQSTLVWNDHWISSKSGVVGPAGMPGSFENGAGLFHAEDNVDGKPAIYASIWDRITGTSCRWRQAASYDGGKSWDHNWIMHWARV
ncbi:MAG TPA: twin-arginine translocation signal domain-containing protein [Micropepsaceae bacterium]|nr:twin-arginine translocation signal domain-containing protein [Micropepsaceae bacterium]